MRIALNGFGRIGKNFFHTILKDNRARTGIELVAINIGPGDPTTIAYQARYDTLIPPYTGSIEYKENCLFIDNSRIEVFAETDPIKLPWKKLEIDWVVEASGKFTHAQEAKKHLQAGAKKVLITAPAHDEDITIIPGVNHREYDNSLHHIVSLGSCTTNAVVPVLKVLFDKYHIEYAFLTTAHAYTNSQKLLDVDATAKHIRRSRAAAVNIIPTSTGAVEVVGKVIPELKGKVGGCALRVPVPVVSIIDITFSSPTSFDRDSLNATFKEASGAALKNILDISYEPLVSSDYHLNSHSVIVDAELTDARGNLGKVFGWYDNEWGYSCRLKDFLLLCNY